ncbi:glycerophosphodiester phosphodiesterase family protein [Flavihumibacter petaseus]|uniref:Putative glycerophosphoryl diester phosphodiesterase n=1 Tax=Flavihumibacter petaseus NBRC 106054 TaxID=1220578 RepID=A0A0E9N771_9BACT|nr:glycerophosphodiester phosphodiesterase family protein [Flavihumibacter petaseus]GAO45546.1 putative glycerophosphoryl diester phosphodiesterase [Flavihumibacter petaseus NBRC 106054]
MKKAGWLGIFLLSLGCLQPPARKAIPLPAVDNEGHRGCRGLLPENSIAAMLYALDLGVTTLEMDVVISADGQVLLSHEPFFNAQISSHPDGRFVDTAEARTLNIYQMNYADIRQYDVGNRQHPAFPQQRVQPAIKPLLADVIDSVEQYALATGRPLPFYNIETKTSPATDDVFHPRPAPFVKQLLDVVNDKKVGPRTIIQSFDFRTLREVHRHYPKVRTSVLIDAHDHRSMKRQIRDLGFVPDIYSPNFQLVTTELVETCHARGMKVVAWTANNRAIINRLKQMGVDGIISDYPDLLTRKK